MRIRKAIMVTHVYIITWLQIFFVTYYHIVGNLAKFLFW